MGLGEVALVSSVLRCLKSTVGAWTYLSGWSKGRSVNGTCWIFCGGNANMVVGVLTPVWR